jgi:hypothetical protein
MSLNNLDHALTFTRDRGDKRCGGSQCFFCRIKARDGAVYEAFVSYKPWWR